jgi:myo-inositol-1(or 4)-monophosphatase
MAATPALETLLDVALDAAEAAAHEVVRGWSRRAGIQVMAKGAHDLTTSVDLAAEAAALAVIRAARPDDGILAEESGGSTGADALWVVDPLDGTLNFSRGIPHCAVSVACLHHGRPQVAVIIDPLRSETFTAMRGAGARLGAEPLRVADATGLAGALVATVFPKRPEQLAAAQPAILQALGAGVALRRSGAMVLDLAYVAAGRFDGFWQRGMHPWDMAAGALLVTEAGGHMGFIDGFGVLDAGGCIAATPALAGPLRALVGG